MSSNHTRPSLILPAIIVTCMVVRKAAVMICGSGASGITKVPPRCGDAACGCCAWPVPNSGKVAAAKLPLQQQTPIQCGHHGG